MKITNHTRRTILSEDATEAKSFIARSKGLIGDSHPHALILHTRFGIHTLGMNYPIDVIILSSENKVVQLKKNLKPNSLFLWNPRYSIVLELPTGIIAKSKTVIGDTIQF